MIRHCCELVKIFRIQKSIEFFGNLAGFECDFVCFSSIDKSTIRCVKSLIVWVSRDFTLKSNENIMVSESELNQMNIVMMIITSTRSGIQSLNRGTQDSFHIIVNIIDLRLYYPICATEMVVPLGLEPRTF